MHAGGPFTDKEALEKSSSDGFVKEVLIWQHRALMLPSPSPGSPMSISGRSRTWIQSWEARRAPEEERGRNERRDGENKTVNTVYSYLEQTQLASKERKWSA